MNDDGDMKNEYLRGLSARGPELAYGHLTVQPGKHKPLPATSSLVLRLFVGVWVIVSRRCARREELPKGLSSS